MLLRTIEHASSLEGDLVRIPCLSTLFLFRLYFKIIAHEVRYIIHVKAFHAPHVSRNIINIFVLSKVIPKDGRVIWEAFDMVISPMHCKSTYEFFLPFFGKPILSFIYQNYFAFTI